MALADHSGVNATGFEPENSGIAADRHGKSSLLSRLSAPLSHLSPTSLALIVSTFGCAAMFTGYDTFRTLAETRDSVAMMATLAAAEFAPRALETSRAAPIRLPARNDDTHLFLTGPDGSLIAATEPGHSPGAPFVAEALGDGFIAAAAPIAEDFGAVTIAVPYSAPLREVAYRSGASFGAVLLLGLVVMRRRPRQEAGTAVAETGMLHDPMLDRLPYGVAQWDATGRLVASTAPFAALLRLERKMLEAGCRYAKISARIGGKINLRPVVNPDAQRVIEVERGDGTVVMLDERPCEDGGFLTIVSDITERKAADRMLTNIREEQRQLVRRYHEEKIRAEAASRAKTAFLAHLSHDIRTPLNHIIGFADLIRHETYGPLGDPKYLSYVDDIKSSGEKLLGSFADILELAELEGGRKELDCDDIDLAELVTGMQQRYGAQAQRAGLDLVIGDCAEGVLHADRHCLQRMLGNLIENAIKFTPSGGEIRLAAWAAEDGVVLEVSDTGIGMPEEQLARLSQPFALGDATFTRKHEGAGLGIAIARTIAELSGGRLAIDSMAAVGTTIAVSLPFRPRPATLGGEARPAEPARAA